MYSSLSTKYTSLPLKPKSDQPLDHSYSPTHLLLCILLVCISSVSFLPQELPGPQEGLRVLELPTLEGEGGKGKGRRKGRGGEEIGKEERGGKEEGRRGRSGVDACRAENRVLGGALCDED